MGKPYSMDLRERVVAAIEGGVSTRQAAERFAIGNATAGSVGAAEAGDRRSSPAKQGKPKGRCWMRTRISFFARWQSARHDA